MANYYAGVTVTASDNPATKVAVSGSGVPGATISYIKDGGTASSTTATVGSGGSWSVDLTLSELAVDSNSIYSVAFKQTVSGMDSVTTVPLKFKVQASA